MFDNLDDPKTQMMLAMAAGLLSPVRNKGWTGFAESLGHGVNQGLLGYQTGIRSKEAIDRGAMERKLQQQQLEQMQRAQADQEYAAKLAPQFFSPGNAPADGMGPAMPPKQDFSGYGQALMARNPQMGMPFIQAGMKDNTPLTVKEGESLVDRNSFKPIFTNPKVKDNWVMLSAQEARALGLPPNQGYQKDTVTGQLKAVGSGPQTVVDVKYGNSFASALGGKTAELLDNGRAQAQAGADSIQTASGIRAALDSNKAFTGPGANVRLKLTQIAPMIGLQGDPEGVQKTREVIVGLSKQALAARGSLKGQGQISDFEGKLLERASAGNVEDMTAGEIKTLLDVNERLARLQIKNHNRIVDSALKKPEFAEQRDIYHIPEPPAYSVKQAPAQSSGPTLDDIANEILRRRRGQNG